mmetsp:Transcript_61626/g.180101  ORF Transcript_61626/g.180101 Transcript_61626/m.180101 type:complete len:387 (-) Transcript_61626:242-1402(-)
MRVAMLVQVTAAFLFQMVASGAETPAMQVGVEKFHEDQARRSEAEQATARITAEARQTSVLKSEAASEVSHAKAEKQQADQEAAIVSNEMEQAQAEKSQAQRAVAEASLEMKHTAAEKSQARKAAAEASAEMQEAQAETNQARQATAGAATEMKRAHAEENQSQQAIAAEKSEAEQAIAKARGEMEQAQAAKIQAEQATANANDEVKDAAAAKASAERESVHTATIWRRWRSTMICILVGLSIPILLLVAAAVALKRELSRSATLDEALLSEQERAEPEPVKPEPKPQPRPFEGKWKREDGEKVCIDRRKIVHPNGQEEHIADLESQTLYTHRMSIKKGWFGDTPVVTGSGGKVSEDGRITWDDGRVWVRADDSSIGAGKPDLCVA